MYDFTLVTYDALPELDPDDRLLYDALTDRGHRVRIAIWNEPVVDWSLSGICVVRSTWDYHLDPAAFIAWLHKVNAVTTLVNPLDLMVWNSHKTYLRDLQTAGVTIVPTVFLDRDATAPGSTSVDTILEANGWTEGIIKPSIGLATSGVRRVARGEGVCQGGDSGADSHLNGLLNRGTVLVQEFMPAVFGRGERSLSFVNGEFTHCVKKAAFQKLAKAGHAGEEFAVAEPDELQAAKFILSTLKCTPLYARVDLVRNTDDVPALMELELIEPSLFMSFFPECAERFANALCQVRHQSSALFVSASTRSVTAPAASSVSSTAVASSAISSAAF